MNKLPPRQLIFETSDPFGSLKIYFYAKNNILLIRPAGIINPSLIKADLRVAADFGNRLQTPWVYLVNTESVVFPNPLNLVYLKRIKELPGMSSYVLYAPSRLTRLAARLTWPILRPDRILKTRSELENLLEHGP